MDLGFNTEALHNAAARGGWTGNCSFVPDWQELASRLHASWAARRDLMSLAGNHSPRCGNFDPAAAEALTGFNYASRAVNLTASANRKPGQAIDVSDAGNSASGARG